jgi:hypothetical protein
MFFVRFFITLPVALLVLLTPVAVFAANSTSSEITKACDAARTNGGVLPTYCSDTAGTPSTNNDNALTGPNGILTKVTNVIGFIAGTVAVAIIIIAGGRLVLSRGDSAKIVSARQSIIYALVGLVVIIIASQVIIFVLSRI